jgi:hypothetical protein
VSTVFATVLNHISTTLGSSYSSGTSLVLASGAGAALNTALSQEGQPSISSTNWIRVTLDDGTNAPTIFKATALSTDTLTVVSTPLDGTVVPGGGYSSGVKVQLRLTTGALRDILFFS